MQWAEDYGIVTPSNLFEGLDLDLRVLTGWSTSSLWTQITLKDLGVICGSLIHSFPEIKEDLVCQLCQIYKNDPVVQKILIFSAERHPKQKDELLDLLTEKIENRTRQKEEMRREQILAVPKNKKTN